MADWRTLQLHHVAGQAYDDLVAPLCANCHSIMSDAQGDHPPGRDDAPGMLDRIGRLLVNLADFFGQLASKFKEFGEFLIGYARSLEDGAGA
jgi:hypothetical protein